MQHINTQYKEPLYFALKYCAFFFFSFSFSQSWWEDLWTKAKIMTMQGSRRLKLPPVSHNEVSSVEKIQINTYLNTRLKKHKVNLTGDNKAWCTVFQVYSALLLSPIWMKKPFPSAFSDLPWSILCESNFYSSLVTWPKAHYST